MKNLMILVVLLASCGTVYDENEPGLEREESLEDADNSGNSENNALPPEIETEEFLASIALENSAEMPECEVKNLTQLTYIMDTNLFFLCTKTGWQNIQLSGEKGDKGDTGEDGVTTVIETEVLAPNRLNIWEDPVTNQIWFMGAKNAQGTLVSVCTGDYRSPTQDEVQMAAFRGMVLVAKDIGVTTGIWTDTPGLCYDFANEGVRNCVNWQHLFCISEG